MTEGTEEKLAMRVSVRTRITMRKSYFQS